MSKKEVNYYSIIEQAVIEAKELADWITPHPIGTLVDLKWKETHETGWLCWVWSLLVKKRNRKFAKAIVDYCIKHDHFCEYSDYHKAYYVSICHYMEYERLNIFYGYVYKSLVVAVNDESIINYEVRLD